MTPHTPHSYPGYELKSLIRIKLTVFIKNRCVECVDYILAFVSNKNFNTLPLIIAVLRVCRCVYSLNDIRFTPLQMFREPSCAENESIKQYRIHKNTCLKSSRRSFYLTFKKSFKNPLQLIANQISKNQARLNKLKTICFNLVHLIESRMA